MRTILLGDKLDRGWGEGIREMPHVLWSSDQSRSDQWRPLALRELWLPSYSLRGLLHPDFSAGSSILSGTAARGL